jgi:N-glycosylase/DNA lyase
MVSYATFKLTAEAERWWTSKKDHLQQQVGEGVPITWKDFKDAFLERFFPQSVRLSKAQEFKTSFLSFCWS